MSEIIEPRVLKGFRDYLPKDETARRALMEVLEKVFRSYGFVPIDTPALEYAEVLLGKGGGETDKQVYRFQDKGGRDVALRFDLTVPFARFMAEHVDELYLPFRRYHMAKVWRGENTQRGRYREFMQCDFDIVGTDSASADTDIILLIADALAALDVGGFTVRVNHRGVFNRFLESSGVRDKSGAVLRLVDKLEKIGADEVRRLLAVDIGEETAGKVLEYVGKEDGFERTLAKVEGLAGGPEADTMRLREIWRNVSETGFPGKLVLDPSITRGLDYYTGVVFETNLDAMPEIGSVCSGGRYDELASLYTTKRLPGVGSSIGLDRLLAALDALEKIQRRSGYTQVLVLAIEDALTPTYHRIARALRSAGIAAEVFPEQRKLAQQFSYADRKGIPLAVILGTEEAAGGIVQLRDLETRASVSLPFPAGDASLVVARAGELLARTKP
ncbi:MAG: histidine--tRNA ligase [Rectinemataceae bacterium]|jgi:histidyl-tRNA synthetase